MTPHGEPLARLSERHLEPDWVDDYEDEVCDYCNDKQCFCHEL